MAAKKTPAKASEHKKITVIFDYYAIEQGPRAVEFEGDTFALINSETQFPVYVITNEEKPSNIFIDFGKVMAIGFTEDVKPIIEEIEKANKKRDEFMKCIDVKSHA